MTQYMNLSAHASAGQCAPSGLLLRFLWLSVQCVFLRAALFLLFLF